MVVVVVVVVFIIINSRSEAPETPRMQSFHMAPSEDMCEDTYLTTKNLNYTKILVHPRKLTCPLKRSYFNRIYIVQPLIFRGHVSFRGSISLLRKVLQKISGVPCQNCKTGLPASRDVQDNIAQNNHKVFDSIQNYPNYPKSCKLTKIITQIIKNYPKYNLIITQIIQKCSIYKYNLTEKIKSTPPKTNMEPENSIHFFPPKHCRWLGFSLLYFKLFFSVCYPFFAIVLNVMTINPQ